MKRTIRHSAGRLLTAALALVLAAALLVPCSALAAEENAGLSQSIGSAMGRIDQFSELLDKHGDFCLTIEPSSDLLDMLSSETEVDLSWIEEVKLRASSDVKLLKTFTTIALELNGDMLITAEELTDLDEGMMFVRIPDLSDQCFSLDLFEQSGMSPEMMRSMVYEIMGTMVRLSELELDEGALAAYAAEVQEFVVPEAAGKEVVEAQGISAVYDASVITLTGSDIKEITAATARFALESEQIREIILELERMTQTELYPEFVEAMNEMAAGPEGLEDVEITLTLYTDEQGMPHGETVAMNGTELGRLLIPADGDDFGFEYSVFANETTVSLVGSGVKSDDSISGSFTVLASQYDDQRDVCYIDISDLVVKADEGYCAGEISLTPSRDILDGLVSDPYVRLLLRNASLVTSFEIDKDSCDVTLNLLDGSDSFVKLRIESASGGKASIPEIGEAVDQDTWMQNVYSSGALEEFMQRLYETDIPDELLDSLMQ